MYYGGQIPDPFDLCAHVTLKRMNVIGLLEWLEKNMAGYPNCKGFLSLGTASGGVSNNSEKTKQKHWAAQSYTMLEQAGQEAGEGCLGVRGYFLLTLR